jgi:hypothetical protein
MDSSLWGVVLRIEKLEPSQAFFDHLNHHRPKESIPFLTMLVKAGLKVFVVVVQ